MSKDVYIDGDIWTNFSTNDLCRDGVTVRVSGEIVFSIKKNIPSGSIWRWVPRTANNRYSIVSKQITKPEMFPEKVKEIISCSSHRKRYER